MADGRDDRSGRFTAKYDPEVFVSAIRDSGGFAGTAELAERVGAPHRTTYDYLSRLRDDGRVSSRSVGGGTVWVLSEDGT